MKVAAVVITYNDDYKLNEWFEHHQLYKDELYMHIIVDNGSQENYLKKVESLFTDSILIKRTNNGGCTAAYNDGIRYALSNPDVDAILLIANDIKLETGGITNLYKFLMGNNQFGKVSPVLLEKNSNTISDFGCLISKSLSMKPFNAGADLASISINERESEALTGGINLSKREFYELVGLQDEKLFMYSDEVDMGIRAKKNRFKLAVTKEVKAWHQHINFDLKNNTRHPFTSYLIGRNKIYLSKKHYNCFKTIYVFTHYTFKALFGMVLSLFKFNRNLFKKNLWLFLGLINGLFGNMKRNKYSVPFSN